MSNSSHPSPPPQKEQEQEQEQEQVDTYSYLSGLGNSFSSEAVPGSLPAGQNSPLLCPLGLYAEQLSGTSFTSPRHRNLRTSVHTLSLHPSSAPPRSIDSSSPNRILLAPVAQVAVPDQAVGDPRALPPAGPAQPPPRGGLRRPRHHRRHAHAAPLEARRAAAARGAAGPRLRRRPLHRLRRRQLLPPPRIRDPHVCCQQVHGRMRLLQRRRRFPHCPPARNPELLITTECGKMLVPPGEIVAIPQGFRFAVDLPDGPSRGYVSEIFGAHFQLPDLGPIGANGLAAARDFLSPTAWFEQAHRPGYTIVQKYGGELFTATQDFSPFNVVAWHGNYVPYKYDLSKFCPFNTVLFDHADPSVNTVLTAPTDKPGVALLDFVIFPPRWLVAENTFRPPYYHRNCMSEFMGLIYGTYEAKADGFLPGGASLHSCMTPHGPDTRTYEATISRLGAAANNEPSRLHGTLAFMFESALIPRVCRWALESPSRDLDYYQCWIGLKSHFSHDNSHRDGDDGPATTTVGDDEDGKK